MWQPGNHVDVDLERLRLLTTRSHDVAGQLKSHAERLTEVQLPSESFRTAPGQGFIAAVNQFLAAYQEDALRHAADVADFGSTVHANASTYGHGDEEAELGYLGVNRHVA